jgi:hypothetical protein
MNNDYLSIENTLDHSDRSIYMGMIRRKDLAAELSARNCMALPEATQLIQNGFGWARLWREAVSTAQNLVWNPCRFPRNYVHIFSPCCGVVLENRPDSNACSTRSAPREACSRCSRRRAGELAWFSYSISCDNRDQ